MFERLQQRLAELKKRDTAHTKAYFITEALRGFGHSPLLGGQECADFLHNMGMDDQTILKMQRKFLSNPHDMRESLEQKIFESL